MLVMRRTAFAALAKPVIEIMCSNDQYNCGDQQIDLIIVKELFGSQENKTNSKDQYRLQGTVVFYIAMK